MFFFVRFSALVALFYSFYSQAQVTDDFSDGELSNDPSWSASDVSGNGADFQVAAEELQSNGPAATSTIWLSTAGTPDLSAGVVVWEFKVRYGFSPSSSNNVEVFLASDKSELDSNPTGYYVRLGESGSGDGIDLFKTSSSTAVIADPNATVASGIDVNIRVTRDTSGLWTLEADPAGGTSFNLIGTATDTEFVMGPYFGFKVEHTSTRSQDFFFDDVAISVTDVSPPFISQLDVLSNSELKVTFSEDLDPATAENAANYTLDQGIGEPAMVDAVDNIVYLTFSNPFVNAQTYELTIINVADLNGNTTPATATEFLYFQEVRAVAKDVIINEILPDPDPPNDLPVAEYVEIMNNSNKIFDLSGWTFADQASVVALEKHFLLPGELLILCSQTDSADFTSFGQVMGLSSWPSLNNNGDYLFLKDNNGTTIDSVNYARSWYSDSEKSAGGWSLELINPANSCHIGNNWKSSESSSGGTPGQQNSVFDPIFDQEAPNLISAWALDETIVELTFDEPLDPFSIDVLDLQINSSINIISATPEPGLTEVHCKLSAVIPMNTSFEVRVDSVSDCSGNIISSNNTAEFILAADVATTQKDVIINEIFPQPDDEGNLPNAEYLELYNNSNKILNLDEWIISDGTTTGEIEEVILFPGDYLILCDEESKSLFNGFGDVAGLIVWPSLNNTGDNIMLKNNSGDLVDSVNYNGSWFKSSTKSAGGWALELIDPNNLCSDSRNWAASESDSGGTPGEVNSILSDKPDLTGPELEQALGIAPDSVIIKFNEVLGPESVMTGQYTITPEIRIKEVVPGPDLQEIGLILSEPLSRDVLYTITIESIRDCSGNLIGNLNSKNFRLIEPAGSSDIVINEILFNPRKGGVDFVELYNRSDKYINLKSWIIANGKNRKDSIEPDQFKVITEADYIIEPSEYVAVTVDEILLKEEYPFGKEDRFLQCSSMPAFPDEEGVAVIMRPDSLWMDSLIYSADWHFDLLSEDEGVSLERVSAKTYTNQPDNWKSTASTAGFATPGYLNSQSRPKITSQKGEITIEPKVIIPDGDGQNDFATIGYLFEKPGYVANVKVLDLQGRTIRTLCENGYLAAEGFFTWDATEEDGSRARTGYYLVYFEVFDLEGETQQYKEKVVVGTRF